ncbi:MAG: hypothetical protein IJU61_08000, partial [Victivallales bacterium]|nr:hypothetical protein [Victivallales bacterium]
EWIYGLILDAWEFFSAIVTWMFCASCILTLLCMYFAQPLSQLIAPGFSHQKIQRLAFFMRIILPAQIFFLTGSCATALLFLRKQFRIPALTPLIYNGAIIACGLCLPYASEQIYGMTGYCFGVTLGAFLGAFLLPFFVAKGGKLHIHVRFTHPYLKKFFLIAMPLMLGQTIVMLDEPLLRIFGSFLEAILL